MLHLSMALWVGTSPNDRHFVDGHFTK